jgi:dihydroflavonol-4-reductase
MKTVFVTGGTGFLGSHLLEALTKQDDILIKSLYRSEESLKDLLDEIPDLRNSKKLQWVQGDLFSDGWSLEGVEIVYHLAGFVGYKEEDRKKMDKVNVEGTKRLLEMVSKLEKKPKFIHLSSVVAVGAGLDSSMVLDENSKYNVSKYNLGYFETKKKAEDLVFEYANRYNFFAVCLNPSTIYGPRDMKKSSRKGQLSMARGRLNFYPEGGVSIVHVKDVCSALLKAPEFGVSGERYILSGDNITIYALLKAIAEICGKKPPKYKLSKILLLSLGFLGSTLSKVGLKTGLSFEKMKVVTMYHWFKSEKAQKNLDFKPTPYKKCLEDSLNWAKKEGLLENR